MTAIKKQDYSDEVIPKNLRNRLKISVIIFITLYSLLVPNEVILRSYSSGSRRYSGEITTFGATCYFSKEVEAQMKIKLPKPRIGAGISLSEALNKRHSWRRFSPNALKLEEVSQILWAGGGRRLDAITGATRTYPSAGATYPLEIYLLVGKNDVEGLEEGLYLYLWDENALEKKQAQDVRGALASACLGQGFIAEAPISVIIVAEYIRTTGHYGQRGIQYVHMEAGNVTQNLHLVVEELGLGTVIVGAFSDSAVKKVLGLPKNLEPLAVIPIGYKK